MAKSKPRGSPSSSPANHQELSFLHPQATGAVWTYLPLWLLVAFVLRATVALAGDFLLHPDEIMQYLEPAHRLVFGNGVVFWEYFYGARSWIMPGVVAGVLWLCSLVGLDAPQYYVAAVKLVFCALSLMIPLGMYLFCRRHWGEPSARLALLLGVFWYELVAFAHKPMTEFIAAGLLCVLLAILPPPVPSHAWRRWAVAGAVGALAMAVRFQYAPMIGLILLVGMSHAHTRGRLAMLGGGVAVVCAVGVLETLTWGMPFHSYWVNAAFNLALDESRANESSPWLMPWLLLHASCGLVVVAVVSLVGHVRRRGFVVVLLALILIPHMLSAHREYRFIFAAVPLWLMLFADGVAVASKRLTPSGAWLRRAGVGVAVLVSLAGLFNAIPDQNSIYKSFSKESSHFSFVRDRDPGLQLYRRLSEDDAVRGVLEAAQEGYMTSGGYYYLHRLIPFYDGSAWIDVAGDSNPADYVSHIIARTSTGGGTPVVVNDPGTGEQIPALKTDHGYKRFPFFIGDSDSGELVYWSKTARRQSYPDYTIVDQVGDLVLWQRHPPQPLRQWRDHQIIVHPGPRQLRTVESIFGEHTVRIQPPNYGMVFTDD